ncbi:MAG: DUF4162 domain-containing protein, partial [Clostridia bacterium]|nr:DUF4162 domain-containing protein [Clostridia bacterium]
ILSDVERICTDIAFLDEGRVKTSGSLADIKAKYRADEYVIETENAEGANALFAAFPMLNADGGCVLSFKDAGGMLFDILRFVSEKGMLVLRIERREPSLEALFVEAVEK